MPLEALRRSITPIGMHYVLVPFDLAEVDTAAYELVVDGRVHSLALTLDEGGGRIWRRVRSRWHDEAIRVRRVHGDAAVRGEGHSPVACARAVVATWMWHRLRPPTPVGSQRARGGPRGSG
jgi:hypothetical protein